MTIIYGISVAFCTLMLVFIYGRVVRIHKRQKDDYDQIMYTLSRGFALTDKYYEGVKTHLDLIEQNTILTLATMQFELIALKHHLVERECYEVIADIERLLLSIQEIIDRFNELHTEN